MPDQVESPKVITLMCGDCRLCCQLEHLIVNLKGNEVDVFRTAKLSKTFRDERFLSKSSSGACVYLKPWGCGVYKSRPIVCKTFSCFIYLDLDKWKHYKNTVAWNSTVIPLHNAAKELRRRHRISIASRFNSILRKNDR
jgi:Fe-S-cluster containining protein